MLTSSLKYSKNLFQKYYHIKYRHGKGKKKIAAVGNNFCCIKHAKNIKDPKDTRRKHIFYFYILLSFTFSDGNENLFWNPRNSGPIFATV